MWWLRQLSPCYLAPTAIVNKRQQREEPSERAK
jgi:hypothetical protein